MGESSWNGYERNCFFTNLGKGSFLDVARGAGGDAVRDGRGVAIADLDGDGRLDVVIANNHAPPTFYLNRMATDADWLELELVGQESSRDAVGARVSLTLRSTGAGGGPGIRTLTRWVEAGSGYASQSAFPIHFGLGEAWRPEALEIAWPSGRLDRLRGADLGVNRRLRIEEGGGEPGRG